MKVYIKNNVLSLGAGSTVVDEKGETVFAVKGVPFSFTRKKKIYDKEDNLLYVIKNSLFNIFNYKTKIYNAKEEKIAKVSISKGWVKEKYKVSGMDDEMEIVGAFFSRECSIQRNGQEVGKMKKETEFFGDGFSLEAEESELPFLTALVIAFDNINDEREKKK